MLGSLEAGLQIFISVMLVGMSKEKHYFTTQWLAVNNLPANEIRMTTATCLTVNRTL
jgi:hypothetical protein